jgi:hypothetical protein
VPFLSSAGLMALHSIAAMLRHDEPSEPDPDSSDQQMASPSEEDVQSDQGFQLHFKLLNPQPRVEQILEMVGFSLFLEIYHDRETAIASF